MGELAEGAAAACSGAGAAEPPARELRVVCVGGGTGQPGVIGALRHLPVPVRIDAVVAMADDGRSTGALRREEGILPPGDVRNCLVALAADPHGPLARALGHRFGYLENHALGNLLITALVDEGLGFSAAVDYLGGLLGCVGRALPSTLDDVTLAGRTAAGEVVRGQASLSYGAGRLERVWLERGRGGAGARGEGSEVAANPAVLDAIRDADLIVLGPGSLFTSLLPNLLVPGVRDAVRGAVAPVVFVAPRSDVPGETQGMGLEEYVSVLERDGLGPGRLDALLVHAADAPAPACYVEDADELDDAAAAGEGASVPPASASLRPGGPYADVDAAADALERLARRIPHVLVRDLADRRRPTVFSEARLSAAIWEVMGACRSARR